MSLLGLAGALVAALAAGGATAATAPTYTKPTPVLSLPAPHQQSFVQELAAGDIDGDGLDDIVVTSSLWLVEDTLPLRILVNDGNGGLVDRTTALFDGAVPETQTARQIELADFNGDGRLDILVADHGYDAAPWDGWYNVLVLSTPDGKLRDASANLPRVKAFTHSIGVGDVDADGDLDILSGGLGHGVKLLLNDGNGDFEDVTDDALPMEVGNPARFSRVALVDLDGDDAAEAVMLGEEWNDRSVVLWNDGTGIFETDYEALPPRPFSTKAIGLVIRPLHLDGDGNVDLVLGWTQHDPRYKGRWLQLVVNDGERSFIDETSTRLPQSDNVSTAPYDVILRDLDGDGDDDLSVVLGSNFGEPLATYVPPFYVNDGSGRFSAFPATAFESNPYGQHVITDLDGDDRLDVVSAYGERMGQPTTFYVSRRLPASGTSAALAWCADAALDTRDAAGRQPKQGVVAIERGASTVYRARSILPSGALGTIPLAGHTSTERIVSAWQTPATCIGARTGGWAVSPDGKVFTDGAAARHRGDMAGKPLNRPVVGMSPSPTGSGYWLVASDGGMFTFGDAAFLGSTGNIVLNRPIVAMASTPSGRGYWLAASDGGLFTFGDATFFGSMGATPLNAPIVGMVPTASGRGYWMVASDGGIFTFGDAVFKGSTGGRPTPTPIAGMVTNGAGYTLVEESGALHPFG